MGSLPSIAKPVPDPEADAPMETSASLPSILPISVVLPTRNSMDKLPDHLEKHAQLFARCAQIIHCDSLSSDGTKPFLADSIRHPNLSQIDHPPGLYESWNYAIQHCSERYIYISTIGDSIALSGLIQMFELAENTSADVVLSPPDIVTEQGAANSTIQWPIHRLIAVHRICAAGPVSSRLIFAEAVLHAPDGIMGSAASCLYRTSFLKSRPYPLGYHGVSDSVWALRYILEAHCAVIPQPFSTFLLHPKSYESHAMVNSGIAVLIRRFIRRELNRQVQPEAATAAATGSSFSLPRTLLDRLSTYNRIVLDEARWHRRFMIRRRAVRKCWYLSPRAWSARCARNRLRREARILSASIRASLDKGPAV